MFVSAISLLEPCRVRRQKLSFEFHNEEERTTDTKTTNSFHRMFSVNTLVIKQNDGVRKIFTTKRQVTTDVCNESKKITSILTM